MMAVREGGAAEGRGRGRVRWLVDLVDLVAS